GGWFLRSQPLMVFDWKSDRRLVPLDVGFGRVFKIGRQNISCFIEPSGNIPRDGAVPEYAIAFGAALLYPDFWGTHSRRATCGSPRRVARPPTCSSPRARSPRADGGRFRPAPGSGPHAPPPDPHGHARCSLPSLRDVRGRNREPPHATIG